MYFSVLILSTARFCAHLFDNCTTPGESKYKLNGIFTIAGAFFFLLLPNYSFAQTNPADEGPADTEEEYQKRYQDRISKDRLHGVYIPKNLDDALAQLDKNISEESKAAIRDISEDSVCEKLHNRLGRWMITNWCFYEGSRISHYLRSAGVTYPDDMADFMIIAFHRKLNGKPVEIKALAQYYRETRKKEFQEEKKEGKVLHEEVRKRTPPEGGTPATPPATAPKKDVVTPKGKN